MDQNTTHRHFWSGFWDSGAATSYREDANPGQRPQTGPSQCKEKTRRINKSKSVKCQASLTVSLV